MALLNTIITTMAGRAVASRFGGASAGPAGMLLGAALPFLARRLGPVGMVGLAVGAWAIGKAIESRAEKPVATPAFPNPLPDLERSPDPAPHPGSDLVLHRP